MSSSYLGNPTHYGENTYPSQTDSFQDLMDSDSLDPLGLQQPAPFTASAPRPSVLFSVPQYPSELQPPVVPTMSSGRNDSAQNANKYQTRNIQPEDQLFENSRINVSFLFQWSSISECHKKLERHGHRVRWICQLCRFIRSSWRREHGEHNRHFLWRTSIGAPRPLSRRRRPIVNQPS
jgi:hypothetical protein